MHLLSSLFCFEKDSNELASEEINGKILKDSLKSRRFETASGQRTDRESANGNMTAFIDDKMTEELKKKTLSTKRLSNKPHCQQQHMRKNVNCIIWLVLNCSDILGMETGESCCMVF